MDAVWADLTSLFLGLYEHHLPFGAPPLQPDWQRRWRAHLSGGSERLLLIGRQGGAAAGFFNSRIDRTSGLYQEAYGFIEDAYVREEHRGSGLAQALLGRTEEWCRSRGIDLLRLSAIADNALAVHFWDKSGFRPLMHIMSKSLTETAS